MFTASVSSSDTQRLAMKRRGGSLRWAGLAARKEGAVPQHRQRMCNAWQYQYTSASGFRCFTSVPRIEIRPSRPQALVAFPAKRGSEVVSCQLSPGGLASVRVTDSVALGLSDFSQNFIPPPPPPPPLLQTRLPIRRQCTHLKAPQELTV